MLSRIADSLYWLDRYMERTDNILLILRTEYVLSLDEGTERSNSWQPVLEHFTTANRAQLDALSMNTPEALAFVVADTGNQNSLRALLTRARENARGAQDQITKEVWEQVNHIYHSIHADGFEDGLKDRDAVRLLDGMTEMTTLYRGVASGTMPRSIGWSFMNIGKHTERCMTTLDLTDRYLRAMDYDLEDQKDILYWRQLLLSLSGYELHLKSYRNGQHTRNVVDQVFFNRHFTRSLRYTLDKIGHYLKDVTDANPTQESEVLNRFFGRMHSRVRYADLDLIGEVTPEAFIRQMRDDLLRFTNLLAQAFFSYA
jgi:uncharacterized alpha-E superfamily protein